MKSCNKTQTNYMPLVGLGILEKIASSTVLSVKNIRGGGAKQLRTLSVFCFKDRNSFKHRNVELSCLASLKANCVVELKVFGEKRKCNKTYWKDETHILKSLSGCTGILISLRL